MTCFCVDVCQQIMGCRRRTGAPTPVPGTWTNPAPHAAPPQVSTPYQPYTIAPIYTQPHGCICPPGAEQTCQGPMCPRRAPRQTT